MYIPCQFMTVLLNGGAGQLASNVLSKRWLKGTNIFTCDHVAVPYNHASQHWVCLVVNMQTKAVWCVCGVCQIGGWAPWVPFMRCVCFCLVGLFHLGQV